MGAPLCCCVAIIVSLSSDKNVIGENQWEQKEHLSIISNTPIFLSILKWQEMADKQRSIQ